MGGGEIIFVPQDSVRDDGNMDFPWKNQKLKQLYFAAKISG